MRALSGSVVDPGQRPSAAPVSVTKFIEDNWLRGKRIGDGSFDAISGSLAGKGGLLNFRVRPNFRPVILDPTTGQVVSG